ncbi:MAG: SPOR domain-containing protein [Bacteroidales bacterium]|uniref:HU domain-containing protein n=1 Tax=Longimonas sp. TaxID=2039626 RepID=UPI0039769D04
MELVNHIRDLLYHHDCVVVPGFGGFVTNERSARIDRSAGSFFPPAREVGFNARLDHNDGLLISYLSARLSVNYVDARKLVEDFAGEVNRKLDEGRVVHFEGIGQFLPARDGKPEFDPDPSANFLTDSYGLSFFRYPALDTVQKAGKKKRMPSDKEATGFRRRAKKMLRYAAIGIPLVAAITWGAMNSDLIREFSFDLSSLNPFAAVVDSGVRISPVAGDDVVMPDSPDSATPGEMSSQRRALMYEEVSGPGLHDAAPADAVTGPADEPGALLPGDVSVLSDKQEVMETVAAKPAAVRRHYLVAGSFRSGHNARILRERLEEEGYRSEIIESDRGMFRVSLYSTENPGEALQMLRQVRTMQGRTDTWMLSI